MTPDAGQPKAAASLLRAEAAQLQEQVARLLALADAVEACTPPTLATPPGVTLDRVDEAIVAALRRSRRPLLVVEIGVNTDPVLSSRTVGPRCKALAALGVVHRHGRKRGYSLPLCRP